jgi:ArsR family transcriptional regulator
MESIAISRSKPAGQRIVPSSGSSQAAMPAMDLQARAGEAAALLKALANADRLLLLCQLVGGERHVGELGVLAGIAQPTLSQQLGVLRAERLVATRRDGKQVIYRIASSAALTVLDALCGLFCEAPQSVSAIKVARAPGRPRIRAGKKTA